MIDILLSVVVDLLIWIILLPISLIFTTPIILITSFFGKEGYFKTLRMSYLKVINWWKRWI